MSGYNTNQTMKLPESAQQPFWVAEEEGGRSLNRNALVSVGKERQCGEVTGYPWVGSHGIITCTGKTCERDRDIVLLRV